MDTLDTVLNSFVESIKPYFPDSPRKNPSRFEDFLNYYREYENIDDLSQTYHFLNYLDKKYGFLRNSEIFVKLEFEIIHELIPNLPNQTVTNEYYENMLEHYDNILEKKKDRRRFEKSIDFICKIFQSFCTGKQEFNHSYVQVPIALCVGFGRSRINRNMRRLIYERLEHSKITSAEIASLLQASMLKLYCRFVNFCGKPADTNLMNQLNSLCYTEKQNTKEEDHRVHNKRVRLFDSIHMNVKPLSDRCHIDYVEPYFHIRDGFLYNKKDRILYLDEYTVDIQKEIVTYLNDNYNTVVITMYPYKEQLMIEVNGRLYIKKLWNYKTKGTSIEIY